MINPLTEKGTLRVGPFNSVEEYLMDVLSRYASPDDLASVIDVIEAEQQKIPAYWKERYEAKCKDFQDYKDRHDWVKNAYIEVSEELRVLKAQIAQIQK